jgi:PAS domain S-box-containing protein
MRKYLSDAIKILIVNDDPVQLQILRKFLEKIGVHVISCASAQEALATLRKLDSIDLIITDLYMPGIDGWKLCRLLRSSDYFKCRKVPILVMSATFSGSDAEEITRELGANGFISVPCNPKDIQSAIEKILSGKSERKEVRVLVVEDDTSFRRTICEGLKEYGFATGEASDSTDAHKLFTQMNPDIVILDYHLPDHKGLQLLEFFKSPQHKAAVLVITGDDAPDLAIEVTERGADAFIKKPFKIQYVIDLCEKIRREWSLLRVEKLLEDRTLELRRILETSVDGIITTDPSGSILQINNAVEKMLGYGKDEMAGKNIFDLAPHNEKWHKRGLETLNALKEREILTEVELVWQRKDGSSLEVALNLSLLKDGERHSTGVVASVRDISERKEMESKLLQTEKMRSLGELAAGVAHNFNNALAVILGRTQLLRKIVPPATDLGETGRTMQDITKSLEIIERAAFDGSDTVRRIQEFSRRKHDDRSFSDVDLNEVVQHTIEFTKMRWKDEAESKGIIIRIQKNLSPLPCIAGSASELREVFINLINNALDAMPQGGCLTIETCKQDGHAVITIEDTGTGIPRDIRTRIFDPFFSTKGPRSTGLGMSVSYGIINRHQGKISVESTEGQGTTFTIKLPFGKEVSNENTILLTDAKPRKTRILVIEDEAEVRELLSDILIIDGHEVATAPDGNQGMKLFNENIFDLVVTDLGIPGMSGWQVAAEIKRVNRKIPVVCITGWDIRHMDQQLSESGVDVVVNKPFQVDQIISIVRDGLELRENT